MKGKLIVSTNDGRNQDDDATDFFKLMQDAGVTPLKNDGLVVHSKKVPIPKYRQAASVPVKKHSDPFSDDVDIQPLLAGDTLSYCSHGIQKNTFRKLRGGKLAVIDELDLHGLNSQQARKLLLDFLDHTVTASNYSVRIIHGKGHRSTENKAILKTKVNHWLKEHPRVLAFYSCVPADGGTGAVYVLLKNL